MGDEHGALPDKATSPLPLSAAKREPAAKTDAARDRVERMSSAPAEQAEAKPAMPLAVRATLMTTIDGAAVVSVLANQPVSLSAMLTAATGHRQPLTLDAPMPTGMTTISLPAGKPGDQVRITITRIGASPAAAPAAPAASSPPTPAVTEEPIPPVVSEIRNERAQGRVEPATYLAATDPATSKLVLDLSIR
jgi:hypothetical protein